MGNEAPFKPGDVVELKSGSPPLTVVGHEDAGVRCRWLVGDGDAESAVFKPECLIAVDPEDDTLS